MTHVPAGVVLLAAGRGSRLAPLTDTTHKSLLPVAGRPALQYAIDEALARGVPDLVVVTGDKREAIEGFVEGRYGPKVRRVYNERFAEDTNILSTSLGVEALARPEAGYLVLETDLVVEPAAWSAIFEVESTGDSYWVTRGEYGPELTGGALRADASDAVVDLVYAPRFEPRYAGWPKLLGALHVGPAEVEADRELRRSAIGRSIAQYYMAPWVENLPRLRCRARRLGDLFAESYNDLESYRRTERRFEAALGAAGAAGAR